MPGALPGSRRKARLTDTPGCENDVASGDLMTPALSGSGKAEKSGRRTQAVEVSFKGCSHSYATN